MKTRLYTSADDQFIRARFAEGWSDERIGRAIGRTAVGIASYRHRNDLRRERQPKPEHTGIWAAPGAVETLRQLWGQGYTSSAIGELMGVSRNTIIGKAYRLGLAHGVNRPEPPPVAKPSPPHPAVIQPVKPVPTEKLAGMCETPGCRNTALRPYKHCQQCKSKNMPARTRENVFVGRGGDVFSTPARADVA